MTNPRLRRLRLDFERLETRFRDWPPIRVTGLGESPPEKYRVTYQTRGIYALPNGQIQERSQHVVEINLSLGYPRRAPQCKMLTPIFHPNFDEVSVCIGDFWAASEGLDDLIIRIGRMIAYQEYNTKSPLNGLAAKWAAQHAHMLPVDTTEFAPPSEAPAADSAERVVVRMENGAALAESEAPASAAVAPAESAEVPAAGGLPRLDFGQIAVALAPGLTTLGRSPECHVQLSHPSVSARHAEIVESGGAYRLRDVGSTNGTTVNGSLKTEAILAPGDRIYFGDIEAAFLT